MQHFVIVHEISLGGPTPLFRDTFANIQNPNIQFPVGIEFWLSYTLTQVLKCHVQENTTMVREGSNMFNWVDIFQYFFWKIESV